MPNRFEAIPYDASHAAQTAQAFLEVFTTPPWNEDVSLNDILTQIQSDLGREGAGGVLIHSTLGDNVVAFAWWFAISGRELYERWQPRFTPKEHVPQPEGRGVYLMEFGVVPTMQHHGLGQRLLKSTLAEIEPHYDWIALNTHRFAHAGLALLKSCAFEELDLTGVQVPTRICLMKFIRH